MTKEKLPKQWEMKDEEIKEFDDLFQAKGALRLMAEAQFSLAEDIARKERLAWDRVRARLGIKWGKPHIKIEPGSHVITATEL